MKLFELTEPAPDGYYDPQEDHSTVELDDMRKSKLTLDHIRRLRIMNDVRRLEHEKKIERVQQQYGSPAQGDGGMM
jgi:hypothetical protein